MHFTTLLFDIHTKKCKVHSDNKKTVLKNKEKQEHVLKYIMFYLLPIFSVTFMVIGKVGSDCDVGMLFLRTEFLLVVFPVP